MAGTDTIGAARVPNHVHQAHQWVMAQIAPDFELLDAWTLPVGGGKAEFASALELLASFDPVNEGSAISRALFRLRLRLGAWLGWDQPAPHRPIPGCRESSLRERLPAELRSSAPVAVGAAMAAAGGGFQPIYQTGTEWAAEVSNATVHGVLQLAWIEEGACRWRGRLGVYVKPRGLAGRLYLASIGPFRHLLVYPSLFRAIELQWRKRVAAG